MFADEQFSTLLQQIEEDLNVSTHLNHDQSINQDLEQSSSRLLHHNNLGHRTFNDMSPQRLAVHPDVMSSERQSVSPSKRDKKPKYKMVK